MKNKLIYFWIAIIGLFLLEDCSNSNSLKKNEWPIYQGNNTSSHYSELKQIDTTNVKQLQIAWEYHTRDADNATMSEIECNPIEINGVLYGTSPMLKLFAVNAATGKQEWIFDPFSKSSGSQIRINVNRGVTYWSKGNDKRIFYVAGPNLYAVNAKTGKLITSFGDKGKVDLHQGLGQESQGLFVTATSPGIIYKNLLIMGTRVSEANPAARGYIRAYDVKTGKIKWIFHTIPRPGDLGYNTWEDKNAWKYTGSANCWAGMSLDQKKGIVYIPTGSATFDFYGGIRKGKDLFANCLLALDASSGKLLWYFQTIHHDLWDRDLPAPPNLVTINRDGKKIEAVAQITKTGYVFIFNRYTGKSLFPIKEVPVPDSPALPGEQPWPTQPIPELPKPFMEQSFTDADINNLVPDSSQAEVRKKLAQLEPETNMFLPPSEKGTVIFPGFDGGAEWGGAAYDPTTGLLYINANQVPWSLVMAKGLMGNKANQTFAERGKAIYELNCSACHGKDRQGGGGFPSLQHIGQILNKDHVLNIVNDGRGMMPSFKQTISQSDKEALLSFLLSLKNGNQTFKASIENNNKSNAGIKIDLMPYHMTGYNKIRTPEGYPANRPPWGTLTAIDLNTGKAKWQIPLGEYPELVKKGFPITGTENYGGSVVTAGGVLIIAATSDQMIRAFNKDTGKLLWKAKLPAAGFATPTTYKVNGKQYIVIACGGGKLGTPSGDTYVAFALPNH